MQQGEESIFLRRPTLYSLTLVNAAGAVYGFYWYRFQLAATPWWFWPFVPECPIQALLFAVVACLLLAGRRSPFLETVTYLGLVKYGSWTVMVLSLFRLTGGQLDGEKLFLLFSHVGMALEGLLFLRFVPRPGRLLLFGAPAWFGAMDFLDYGAGIHPWLPNPAQLPAALFFALLGTAFALLWLLLRVLQPAERPEGSVDSL